MRLPRWSNLILAVALGALVPGSSGAQQKAAPAAAAPVPAAAPAPVEKIDTLKRIRETGVIILGVRESSVPFSFLDAQKQPQGYSVDLCLRAADAIKAELRMPRLDVRFVPVSSANRIPALLENKVDLECGSTTNTRDRQKQVAFAYTSFVAGIKMLAKVSSGINGIEDLRGKAVVVTKGTTSEKMLNTINDERLLKLKIIVSPDHAESFRRVETGEAVAFPMDDVLLYGLISRSKKPDDFAVVGKYMSVEPYAIMMRKDEPQLERIVNRALNELFQSGEIRRIYAKWFATKDLTVPLNQYLKEAFSVPNTYPAWP
ncbi:MAG: amino acid ABC transporter substrate-binding protein [Betaproteobacteria bacterium]